MVGRNFRRLYEVGLAVLLLSALVATAQVGAAEDDGSSGDSPAVPAVPDPAGSWGGYRADDLWISSTGGSTDRIDWTPPKSVSASWAQMTLDNGLLSPTSGSTVDDPTGGPAADLPKPPQPQALTPQASGKFADGAKDRVIALVAMADSSGAQYRVTGLPDKQDPDGQQSVPAADLPASLASKPRAATALAAGDLDKLIGKDNRYHDEAVAAFRGDDGGIYAAVIDYEESPGKATLTRLEDPIAKDAVNSVAVAVGDFDGDGFAEPAVVFATDQPGVGGKVQVAILRYRHGKDGPELVVAKDAFAPPVPSEVGSGPPTMSSSFPSLEAAAGDFDARGYDQLAFSFYQGKPAPDGGLTEVAVVGFERRQVDVAGTQLLVVDAPFKVESADGTWAGGGEGSDPCGRYPEQQADCSSTAFPTDYRPRLATGLIESDDSKDATGLLGRRQLIVAYPTEDGVSVQVLYAKIGASKLTLAPWDRPEGVAREPQLPDDPEGPAWRLEWVSRDHLAGLWRVRGRRPLQGRDPELGHRR